MLHYDDYISFVIGVSGVGKSSFINYITESSFCKTHDSHDINKWNESCTNTCNIVSINYENIHYSFADTPGFNYKNDDKVINLIKDTIKYNNNIRCIIFVLPFIDIRLGNNISEIFKKLMEAIPIKNFWEHIFFIRNHAKKDDVDFEEDKIRVEESIPNFFKEHQNLKNFMEIKNIDFPNKIEQFYVNCVNRNRYHALNIGEFKKIFNKIKNTPTIGKI